MDSISQFFRDVTNHPQAVALPAALFFLLAPGNYVIVPGSVSWIEMSLVSPNRTVILTHALLFGLALAYIRRKYPQYS